MSQDFIDTAAQKAMAAFDIAKKKTEEVVAVSKQKIDIATLQSKLDKLYNKLGKAYYASATSDVDSANEIEALLGEIAQKLDEIKTAKEQAADILNKTACPKCNVYNDKKSAFCSGCGTQLK